MAKRKTTTRKAKKKVKLTLDKTFSCVFCNHEHTVSTKLDRENKIAYLTCSACSVDWNCAINALTEPIDVYSEWIDACELVERNQNKKAKTIQEDDDDEDDFVL
jgi:transcription elongation factor Elf1